MFYPQFTRPVTMGVLPDGAAGIRQTLSVMEKLLNQYKKDPGVRELAISMVRDLPQGDIVAEVSALHQFVRDNIRYTNDTRGVETVQSPRATLELGTGDCDDKSLLLATLLESVGRATRFAALAFGQPPKYSHVIAEVRVGKSWLPLETIKNVPIGWYPNGVTKRMVRYN